MGAFSDIKHESKS